MIQIDMPMPKNCFECHACNEYLMCEIPINGRKWGENDVRDFSQGRPEWCPMKDQEAELQKGRYYSNVFDIGYKAGKETIVRCEDCKHGEPWGVLIACGKLRGFGITHNPDWFCADGERKSAQD